MRQANFGEFGTDSIAHWNWRPEIQRCFYLEPFWYFWQFPFLFFTTGIFFFLLIYIYVCVFLMLTITSAFASLNYTQHLIFFTCQNSLLKKKKKSTFNTIMWAIAKRDQFHSCRVKYVIFVMCICICM